MRGKEREREREEKEEEGGREGGTLSLIKLHLSGMGYPSKCTWWHILLVMTSTQQVTEAAL